MQQRSDKWFAARKGRLTGSMAGAALGLAPYMSQDDHIMADQIKFDEWTVEPSQLEGYFQLEKRVMKQTALQSDDGYLVVGRIPSAYVISGLWHGSREMIQPCLKKQPILLKLVNLGGRVPSLRIHFEPRVYP